MADWPIAVMEPLVTIHTYSLECCGGETIATSGSLIQATSSTWSLANRALFLPFWLTKPIVVTQLFCYNGAAVSGNVDMGIYSGGENPIARLVSKGSTAQSGTNVLQAFDITDTQIGPGLFYLAIALDNTTGAIFRTNVPTSIAPSVGLAQMASAFALPATATLAVYSIQAMPVIGLTTRGVL